VYNKARFVLDSLFIEDNEDPISYSVEGHDMLEEDVVDLGRRHAFEGGGEGLYRRSRTSPYILARQEIGLGYNMWQPGPLFGVLQRPGKEGIEYLRGNR
jgi:hypothetical protein